MHPIICQLGPFTIYSYGLMLVLAFTLGLALSILRAEKEGIRGDLVFNFCFAVFIWGIIGARLFYVIENSAYYLQNPLEIIKLHYGGLSWFGALLAGIFSGIVYLRKKKLSLYKMADLLVPFLALAQAVGRIGCLLTGCCGGRASEAFGLYFAAHKEYRIPTQLYSSLVLILIFIILRLLEDRPHKRGQIFYLYLVLYSLKRFFIEFWRVEHRFIFYGLTLFQLISVAVFIFSLLKLLSLKTAKK